MQVPFTPRPRTGGRKNKLTLSAKEYTKVTGTIASVRRNRQHFNDEDDYRGSDQIEPSFIAEESFVRAPLNSRVISGLSAPSPKGKEKEERMDDMPLEVQEAFILEDLLFVLMGIEGTHITYHEEYSPEDDDPLEGVRFVVSRTLDPSLRDLVERILPLATYYTAITAFIEQRSHLDFGLVNHALCASMRDMLKDYQTLLSQLEHAYNSSSQFSLQKLWFYVHPTVHTLSLIYQLTLELATADQSPADSSSSSDDDLDARNEALGLGSAKLSAVLSGIDKNGDSSGIAVKGGEVLTIIHDRLQNMYGDPAARTLYGTLLRAAGRPYIAMLRTWTRTGKLNDPYEELCVKEAKFINRGTLEMDYTDEYWERRYTLRDGSTVSSSDKRHHAGVPAPRPVSGRLPGGACIPPLLESWKHKILLAGKYLNVIRECGIEIQNDATRPDETQSMDDEEFFKSLEADYAFANKTLLQLLVKDQELLPRLRVLKRYFFLSHSPFLTHFLELAHSELRKSAKSASLVKLQSLLALSLGADAHGDDMAFREDVRVTMMGSVLYDFLIKIVKEKGDIGGVPAQEDGAESGGEGGGSHARREKEREKEKAPLSAIDALSLDFAVPFPLSLVVSRKTVVRYQLIFRFLFHLKNIELALSGMWLEQKAGPWRAVAAADSDFARWRGRVLVLRLRMLTFVQQLLAYVTSEVLEPNWRVLEGKLERVQTVDQLLRDHVDFLDTCSKECMMTSDVKLLKAHGKLVAVCQMFAVFSSAFTKAAHLALNGAETKEARDKRWDTISRFEINFDQWFDLYLACVQLNASRENVALLPLVLRLHSVKRASSS
ncbi:gamma-tubulin complex, DGRIP84/SPC97 component [Vararia minispora EC-137]|uniref:Gamma-tubulin complex, DGRIP84/SPC97 component n=1 Tax=Vararia minispora EC-137 TaxID=1314806 RepID=A0ACB8QI07_9AGAM|nr:gamma-tubulin complex, DGRIP84/SPC97 component [Vararia minispora EC-137]